MIALTLSPAPDEVAVARLPAEMGVLAGDLRVAPYGHAGVVAVPGEVIGLGWGVSYCSWGAPVGVTRYRHKRDRGVWQQAARMLRQPGETVALYVVHKRIDQPGKPVWVAVGIRGEGDEQR